MSLRQHPARQSIGSTAQWAAVARAARLCHFNFRLLPSRLEFLGPPRLLYGRCNNGVTQMSDFVPRRVSNPYQFDIVHDRGGHWAARERDGLAGGTFLTRKDALRYALFETGGDRSHIHVRRTHRMAGDAR
jgi:hypothetical protein